MVGQHIVERPNFSNDGFSGICWVEEPPVIAREVAFARSKANESAVPSRGIRTCRRVAPRLRTEIAGMFWNSNRRRHLRIQWHQRNVHRGVAFAAAEDGSIHSHG